MEVLTNNDKADICGGIRGKKTHTQTALRRERSAGREGRSHKKSHAAWRWGYVRSKRDGKQRETKKAQQKKISQRAELAFFSSLLYLLPMCCGRSSSFCLCCSCNCFSSVVAACTVVVRLRSCMHAAAAAVGSCFSLDWNSSKTWRAARQRRMTTTKSIKSRPRDRYLLMIRRPRGRTYFP